MTATPAYRASVIRALALASVGLALFLSAPDPAAALDQTFRIGEADSYPAKQVQGGITVAVKPYHSEALMAEAFGKKARPFEYGILPVLVVVGNSGSQAIRAEQLKVRYVPRGADGVESISGADLAFFNPKGHAPRQRRIPGIGTTRAKVKKGPLARPEITAREFSAPIVAPRTTAGGFFYFNVGKNYPFTEGSIYITGLVEMSSGQELFYFEIPLNVYR